VPPHFTAIAVLANGGLVSARSQGQADGASGRRWLRRPFLPALGSVFAVGSARPSSQLPAALCCMRSRATCLRHRVACNHTGAAHPPSGSYRCRESWRGRGPVWRVGGSCGGSRGRCAGSGGGCAWVRRRLRLGPEAAAPGCGGGCAWVRRRLRPGAEAAAPGCGGSSGEVGGSGARVRGRSPPLPADPGAVRLR